ncbi:MAG: LruC domain-containing protein, partial [Bacteroidota bacterium]
QHTVLLEVPNRDEILLAFEDIERDRPNCDQDFNDVVFYVTADPADAFDREDLPETPPTKDDRDGVPDAEDDEPDDPTIATYEYGPAKDQFGTLAYEDLWPGQGDYDFNDLVVDYTLRFARHADGTLTRLDGRFVVKAIGAAFVNGFALEAPVPAASVASVSGQRLSQNLFTMANNGTEAGRTRAVIPVFDAAQEILSDPATFFANTEAGQPYVPPTDTIAIGVAFAPRIPAADSRALSVTWLNPFLVSNQERGREVHLPDLPPTEGADLALFNTSEDESDVEAGLTYKTWNGLPWALHFVGGFVYPFEEVDITRAYPRFKPWAESGGVVDADWYTNPDYRVDPYLYRP